AEFERLPPEARMRLLQRARVLRERERELGLHEPDPFQSVDPDPRGPEARRERWAHLRERFRERGRKLLERIPPWLRRELGGAPAELRRRAFERLCEQRERISLRAVARIGADLGLAPDEILRLESLPLPERLRALHELHDRAPHDG